MFGARAENPSRASHFANAARRFALDAKMFRCRAAVHVENKDDIAFWGAVLKHFRPTISFTSFPVHGTNMDGRLVELPNV